MLAKKPSLSTRAVNLGLTVWVVVVFTLAALILAFNAQSTWYVIRNGGTRPIVVAVRNVDGVVAPPCELAPGATCTVRTVFADGESDLPVRVGDTWLSCGVYVSGSAVPFSYAYEATIEDHPKATPEHRCRGRHLAPYPFLFPL